MTLTSLFFFIPSNFAQRRILRKYPRNLFQKHSRPRMLKLEKGTLASWVCFSGPFLVAKLPLPLP